jgi:hypothetical protein
MSWRRVRDSYLLRLFGGSILLFGALPYGLRWLGWTENLSEGIYIGTGVAVVWYTVETYKLRREAQTQTELQIRPFLSLTYEVSDRSLLLYNFGRGVARTIRVRDTSVSPPSAEHPVIVRWDAIDFIAPERQRALAGHSTQDGQVLSDENEMWKSNFGPHGRQDLEIVVDYDDLAGNGYRAPFRMVRGVVTLVEDQRRA